MLFQIIFFSVRLDVGRRFSGSDLLLRQSDCRTYRAIAAKARAPPLAQAFAGSGVAAAKCLLPPNGANPTSYPEAEASCFRDESGCRT
jgi:hypothetical protein